MAFASRILRIFLPFMFGFFLTAIYRTVTAIFEPLIEKSITISHTTLAFSTSVFFLLAAIMQIINGVLIDHFGPRRVQASLIFLGGIGSIIYGVANNGFWLTIGRVLLGIGMAGSLMVAFASNRIWFHKQLHPMNTLSYSLGSLGAIVSSWPTLLLLQVTDWRTISIVLGILNFILSSIILLSVPDPEGLDKTTHWKEHLKGTAKIFRNRYFWKLAPLTAIVLGALLSFQSFWVTPWITDVDHASELTASYSLLAIAIATIAGMPFAHLMHHSFKHLSRATLVAGIALLSILCQVLIVLQIAPANALLWFFYALFANAPMLCYGMLSDSFSSEYAGRSVNALNTLTFFAVFAIQYLFGLVNDLFGYYAAFWFCIILQAIALLEFVIVKEEKV